MKKLSFFIALLLLFSSALFAQMGINADNSVPDNSAMLDVKATNRGLLIPRISTAGRSQIPSPATGLLIYNTTTNQFNYYNGSYWFQLESNFIGVPCPGMPTIIDSRDGQVYPTIQIGSQCWLQKNMNYSTGNSWCYDNNSSNCNTYGRLYDWQTALGACPSGWHLPSDAEWTALTTFLGGESVAGGKMKEAGTTHWSSPNSGATNSSGFTALPGGYRVNNVGFSSLTDGALFWSSTETSSTNAWYWFLEASSEYVYRDNNDKALGFSARCVQD
jgi:uncharacterized protein (TIGR02145 family)